MGPKLAVYSILSLAGAKLDLLPIVGGSAKRVQRALTAIVGECRRLSRHTDRQSAHTLKASGTGLQIPPETLRSDCRACGESLSEQVDPMNELSELEIDVLEQSIPEMAVMASTMAYYRTLAAGRKATASRNGAIVEVCPDGSERFLAAARPKTEVSAELKIRLGCRA